MGYLWGREMGEIGNKFRNVAKLFPMEKAHRGGSH